MFMFLSCVPTLCRYPGHASFCSSFCMLLPRARFSRRPQQHQQHQHQQHQHQQHQHQQHQHQTDHAAARCCSSLGRLIIYPPCSIHAVLLIFKTGVYKQTNKLNLPNINKVLRIKHTAVPQTLIRYYRDKRTTYLVPGILVLILINRQMFR